MPEANDDRSELLRRFEAAISGPDLTDLRDLAADLSSLAGPPEGPLLRPDLRRAPRPQVETYRLRVDLDRSTPPIWRRLDVRSDLTLDTVHHVLQAAFGWADSHLHRFSLGGGPFDHGSQLFLCPFDVDEGEDEGVPASDVRLDEVVQSEGEVLRYVYDYGDDWGLTLRLEEVLPAGADVDVATCVDGGRSAPPEDCGGLTDAEDLAEVLEDPAHFDPREVNQALRDPFLMLRECGVHEGLVDLVTRLRFTDVADDLVARSLGLTGAAPQPGVEECTGALRAHLWFLDRASDGGIELTPAGYLKQADVEAASAVVPSMGDRNGAPNREIRAVPVLRFRQALQSLGLLRKHKGRLLLTRAGASARGRPLVLWRHLADRLAPGEPRTFEEQATLLVLAYAATTGDRPLPLTRVADALHHLGWRLPGGGVLEEHHLFHLEILQVLWNVSDQGGPVQGDLLRPPAVDLARAALLRASRSDR